MYIQLLAIYYICLHIYLYGCIYIYTIVELSAQKPYHIWLLSPEFQNGTVAGPSWYLAQCSKTVCGRIIVRWGTQRFLGSQLRDIPLNYNNVRYIPESRPLGSFGYEPFSRDLSHIEKVLPTSAASTNVLEARLRTPVTKEVTTAFVSAPRETTKAAQHKATGAPSENEKKG